jgi:hypothetical protein
MVDMGIPSRAAAEELFAELDLWDAPGGFEPSSPTDPPAADKDQNDVTVQQSATGQTDEHGGSASGSAVVNGPDVFTAGAGGVVQHDGLGAAGMAQVIDTPNNSGAFFNGNAGHTPSKTGVSGVMAAGASANGSGIAFRGDGQVLGTGAL